MKEPRNKRPIRVIISGGGTGGHIFPAVAIAGKILELHPGSDLLFVGALGRMEMEKVPAAGYPIKGLPISGFDRKHLFNNFRVLIRLIQSLLKARAIIRQFRPDVAVGVGGYASAPVLWMAGRMGIPTLIQEQNSYAGVANKWLAKKANRICVAYPGMERFFPKEKLILTGNPIRPVFEKPMPLREEGCAFFGLDPTQKVLLSLGGSLGARTINESISQGLPQLSDSIQLIWQTGPGYLANATEAASGYPSVKVCAFIHRMEMAFAAADLIISRAGASTISELSVLGKACILVPSPNVTEDHQTKNAEALAQKGAAWMIPDRDAKETLMSKALQGIQNAPALIQLSQNILQFAKRKAAEEIAEEVWKLANKSE